MKKKIKMYDIVMYFCKKLIYVKDPETHSELLLKSAESYNELAEMINNHRGWKNLSLRDRNYQTIANFIFENRNRYDNNKEDYYMVYMALGEDKFWSLFLVHRKDTHYLPDDYRPDSVKKGARASEHNTYIRWCRIVSHRELSLEAADTPYKVLEATHRLRNAIKVRDAIEEQIADSIKEEQEEQAKKKPRRYKHPSESRIKEILEEE